MWKSPCTRSGLARLNLVFDHLAGRQNILSDDHREKACQGNQGRQTYCELVSYPGGILLLHKQKQEPTLNKNHLLQVEILR